jgi:hypothetical protein
MAAVNAVSAPDACVAEPFFVVGSERSGTTLLRLMLAHHHAIECAPEFEFLVELVPDGPDEHRWPELARYREWLAESRIFRPHALAIDPALDYPALARSFLAQYGARTRKPVLGATCHKHFDRLLRLWPRARFVHLVRDGRDVARSCVGMGWAGNVWHAAERWIAAESLWDALAPRLAPGRVHELRYEDLVRTPERELERLCAFLGVEPDPGMLAYDRDSSYARPDPRLIGRWRTQLAPAELALLEARIGPLLCARGYEPSGVAPVHPGPLRRLALALADRAGRFRFRRERYGLAHVAASRLARLLGLSGLSGLSGWERRLARARDRIDDQHLQ